MKQIITPNIPYSPKPLNPPKNTTGGNNTSSLTSQHTGNTLDIVACDNCTTDCDTAIEKSSDNPSIKLYGNQLNVGVARVPVSQIETRSADEINRERWELGDRLPDSVLEEFRASGIPDELTLANVEYLSDVRPILTETAIARLGGHSTQYATKSAQRILDRYELATNGGWVTWGQTLDGERGSVALAKLDTPRSSKADLLPFEPSKKAKTFKYETPQGEPGKPILAKVPFKFGLKIAIKDGKGDEYTKRFYKTHVQVTATPDAEGTTQKRTQPSEKGEGSAILGLPKLNTDPSQLTNGEGNGSSGRCQNSSECCQSRDETAFYSACEGGRWAEASQLLHSIWNDNRNGNSQPSNADRGRIARLGAEIDWLIWRWFEAANIGPMLVEGFKKALSLIAQGIPAIAIRGIAMWHKAGGRELHDAIATFATPGRTVYIAFDQDEKATTRMNVMSQALSLGEVLEKAGAIAQYLIWDSADGKGIDDAIAAQGDNATQWLDGIFQNAISRKTYSRMRLGVRALTIIDRRNQSKYQITRVTDGGNTPGGFLPELPTIQPGAINVIDAGVGSGKTTRIGADWLDKSRFTVVISPTNAVGEQTANNWGLPHIHRYRVQDSDILWTEARSLGGVVMCLDSLHRLPDWVGEIPLTIVLDEANQVIDGATSAGTLGDRQSDILKTFASLAEHAIKTGAIVLAEDEVPDRTINFMRSLSFAQGVNIITHRREQQPWDTTLYGGPQTSGFRARLLDAVGRERLLFVSSSQREGKRLEKAIAKTVAGKKIIRIDSETNEGNNLVIDVGGHKISFFDDPDTWISEVKPDVLILSPSAKSGVSITVPWFESVWGYFPALGGDTHWQMLGRYRLPVPRHIYCPPFIQTNSDESLMSARRARQRYQSDAKGLGTVLELSEMLEASEAEQETYTRIQEALLTYRAEQAEVQGAMKAIAYDYLLQRLERAGHNVTEEIAGTDKATSELWRQVQDEIWQDEAVEFSGLDIEATHTEDWAHRTLNSNDSTRINRLRARKVIYRIDFPGVMFDDASECYEALMRDYGAMRRGVRLQAKCQNLEAAKSIDRERASKLLEKDIKALHRMPKDYARAFLLSQLGILDLLDGTEYHNQDPRAIAIKEQALKWSSEIYYRLRLQIKESQSPVEICNKLLRKFGLEINKPDRPGAIQVSQPGGRKDRGDRHYQVNLDYSPVRKRLLEAYQRKLSESVHTICINQNPNIQIACTDKKSPSAPPPDKVSRPGLVVGAIVRWGTSLGDWIITALDGAIATIHQVSGYASAISFTADLSELELIALEFHQSRTQTKELK